MRALPELWAAPGLPEPAAPELPELLALRVLAALPGQARRSELPEPRALPKRARLAQRLKLAALQARRAGPVLAAFPEHRALDEGPSAGAFRASCRGAEAAEEVPSHPGVPDR